MIIYYDSSALIYQTETHPDFARKIRAILAELQQQAPLRFAVSRLSWLECRILPLRSNDQEALEKYRVFFSSPDLLQLELSAAVVERATLLRAHYNLSTPDALQAASCLQLGSQHLMLTGDAAFRRVPGLRVQVLV